jgi:hypothetical protein
MLKMGACLYMYDMVFFQLEAYRNPECLKKASAYSDPGYTFKETVTLLGCAMAMGFTCGENCSIGTVKQYAVPVYGVE